MYQKYRLVPYQPRGLLYTPPSVISKRIEEYHQKQRESSWQGSNSGKIDTPWRNWAKQAISILWLGDIYGPYLTGLKSGHGWLQCRDPESPTGDRNPSAGVSTGEGKTPKGVFHSHRTGLSMSVFDFLEKYDPTVNSFHEAKVRVRDLTGVPFPA